MKIKIENLGNISSSHIDLSKKLIVFSGKNNTGKTWMSYLLYGLYKTRSSIEYKIPESYVKELVQNKVAKMNAAQLIRDGFKAYKKDIEKTLLKQLPAIFKAEKALFEKSTIQIDIELSEIVDNFIKNEIKLEVGLPGRIEMVASSEEGSEDLSVMLMDKVSEVSTENVVDDDLTMFIMKNIFPRLISNAIIGSTLPKPYMATAERTAISLFSKELSLKRLELYDKIQELVTDNAKKDENELKKIGKALSRYSLPISESIKVSEDIENIQKKVSKYADLAKEIEDQILDGTIKVNKDGAITFLPKQKAGQAIELSIHLASSTIKSFVFIVFYLKHMANENDVLIIDEPELNLHPDNQLQIARILAKCVNNGLHVIISTHSDHILREINNLIALKSFGKKAKAVAKKYSYEDNMLLDYKDVGVHLFNGDMKTTTAEIGPFGFDVTTIDDVVKRLNSISLEIAGI
jgi:predicted ATP-dependent endonuclease of OLD family